MIGIIGAMDEEVAGIKEQMTGVTTRTVASMSFYTGVFHNKQTTVVVSGIGKVNAGICTQILIDVFGAKMVINTGVAGGLDPQLVPGDMVVAEDCVQHDMDVSALGDPKGQVPRMDTFSFPCDAHLIDCALQAAVSVADVAAATPNNAEDTNNEWTAVTGRIASGDLFVANPEASAQIRDTFSAAACEMEGAAIAQVCYLNNVPCSIIRFISDNASTGAHTDYAAFKPLAISRSVAVISCMFDLL